MYCKKRFSVSARIPSFSDLSRYLDGQDIPSVSVVGSLRARLIQLGIACNEDTGPLICLMLRVCVWIADTAWNSGGVGRNIPVSVRWVGGGYVDNRQRRKGGVHCVRLFSELLGRRFGFDTEILSFLDITEDMCVSITVARKDGRTQIVGVWGKMDFPDPNLLREIEDVCRCRTAEDCHEVFLELVRLWSDALHRLKISVRDELDEDPVMRILFDRINRILVFRGRRLAEVVFAQEE
jgi:hypothetical protein